MGKSRSAEVSAAGCLHQDSHVLADQPVPGMATALITGGQPTIHRRDPGLARSAPVDNTPRPVVSQSLLKSDIRGVLFARICLAAS